MILPGLADLDDLILTVRDRNSRSYAMEAVTAYRSQAYRAAIISAWIAVVSDIIGKCRELAVQGDGAAGKLIDELDTAIEQHASGQANALGTLQKIENGLLDKARNEFEFISPREYIDLQRLKEDRHLCAHPSFVSQGELFQPTPELVKTHIAHAVLHLLQHPPVQGKSALSQWKQDLMQPSFPSSAAEAQRFLSAKYLKYIKPTLLKNAVTVFVKALIKQNDNDLIGREPQILNSINAMQQYAPTAYEHAMSEVIAKNIRHSPDAELMRVAHLFPSEPRTWNWLADDGRIRLQTLATSYNYSDNNQYFLSCGLTSEHLRPLLLDSISNRHSPEQQERIISNHPCADFTDLAITLYSASGSWNTSTRRGDNLLMPLCEHFSVRDIGRILDAVIENREISGAWRAPGHMLELFTRTKSLHASTKSSWEGLISRLRTRQVAFLDLEEAMKKESMHVPPPPSWGQQRQQS